MRTCILMSAAQAAVNVLYTIGALERVGKEKNTYLYRKSDFERHEEEIAE